MDMDKFKIRTTISHLYLDDIKLYIKNERDINSLIHLTDLQRGHWNVIRLREVYPNYSREDK